jgi:hypothetical protein
MIKINDTLMIIMIDRKFKKNINIVRIIQFKYIIEIQVHSTHLMKILMDQSISKIQNHLSFLS